MLNIFIHIEKLPPQIRWSPLLFSKSITYMDMWWLKFLNCKELPLKSSGSVLHAWYDYIKYSFCLLIRISTGDHIWLLWLKIDNIKSMSNIESDTIRMARIIWGITKISFCIRTITSSRIHDESDSIFFWIESISFLKLDIQSLTDISYKFFCMSMYREIVWMITRSYWLCSAFLKCRFPHISRAIVEIRQTGIEPTTQLHQIGSSIRRRDTKLNGMFMKPGGDRLRLVSAIDRDMFDLAISRIDRPEYWFWCSSLWFERS